MNQNVHVQRFSQEAYKKNNTHLGSIHNSHYMQLMLAIHLYVGAIFSKLFFLSIGAYKNWVPTHIFGVLKICNYYLLCNLYLCIYFVCFTLYCR